MKEEYYKLIEKNEEIKAILNKSTEEYEMQKTDLKKMNSQLLEIQGRLKDALTEYKTALQSLSDVKREIDEAKEELKSTNLGEKAEMEKNELENSIHILEELEEEHKRQLIEQVKYTQLVI